MEREKARGACMACNKEIREVPYVGVVKVVARLSLSDVLDEKGPNN